MRCLLSRGCGRHLARLRSPAAGIGRNVRMKPRILLVDDDEAALERLRHDLHRRYSADYEIADTTSVAEALT